VQEFEPISRMRPNGGMVIWWLYSPPSALAGNARRWVPKVGYLIMKKQELLSALTNTWQNFVIGLSLTQLMPEEQWISLSQRGIQFDGPNGPWFHAPPHWSACVLGDRENRGKAISELEKSLKRALLREGHELILLYCQETHQGEKYRVVPWFQFARIIRNVVSHKQGGILREWPDDLRKKGITSASWRNRTLEITMVGLEISFSHQEALQLFADQFDFAQNQLS